MSTSFRTTRARATTAVVVSTLSATTDQESAANPALRDRAVRVLGTGPVRWAAEAAAVATELVASRNADRPVDDDALGTANEDLLLAILLRLAGRPEPLGTVVAPRTDLIHHVVAHRIRLDRLVASIRLVQRYWTERLLAHVVCLGAYAELRQDLVIAVTQMMDHYLDAQISGFLAEQDRVTRPTSAHHHRRLVEDLVGGRAVDRMLAMERLSLDVDDLHVALVLTTDSHTAFAAESLQMCAGAAGHALGTPFLLRHEPAPGMLWAWAGGSAVSDLGAVAVSPTADARIRIGVGSAHVGAAGFRRSHIEALDAQRVARCGHRGPIVLHRDVALAVLLSADRERARWFVEDHLGPLGEPGEAARELRETLTCFYRSQMRVVTAAAALKVHRNTLIHRMRRIETLLGHSPGENMAEVLCALTVRDLLAADQPDKIIDSYRLS